MQGKRAVFIGRVSSAAEVKSGYRATTMPVVALLMLGDV